MLDKLEVCYIKLMGTECIIDSTLVHNLGINTSLTRAHKDTDYTHTHTEHILDGIRLSITTLYMY